MTRAKTIPLDSSRQAILRITEACRADLERHLYRRYPSYEWGTFFRFGFRVTHWGIALTFVDAVWPQPGDLRRDSPIVTINSEYTLRAVDAVTSGALGVGMIHSHPENGWTFPSSLDDDMDSYYSGLFGEYSSGRPYCSLIFSRSENGEFRFTGRVNIEGEWFPVSEVLTVGDSLHRERSERNTSAHKDGERNAVSAKESVTARLEAILGQKSAERLAHTKVAVIGCSGTGSPAIEVLVRAGVANFVIADPQQFAPSNLERVHGSTLADACTTEAPYKVTLMARMIRDINPAAKITAIVGNLLDEIVLDELLRSDVVLGCTDTQHSRAALSDFATHYLLPVLDVGVVFESRDRKVRAQVGQFTTFRPDQSCAFCEGMIDAAALSIELMTEEEKRSRQKAALEAADAGIDGSQYWRGDTPPLITVGYLTSTIGSLAAGYVIGWLTGKFAMAHSRFQFDISAPEFGFVDVVRSRRSTCSCARTIGFADQCRADRSVTRPSHWPRAVVIDTQSAIVPSAIDIGSTFNRYSWLDSIRRSFARCLRRSI